VSISQYSSQIKTSSPSVERGDEDALGQGLVRVGKTGNLAETRETEKIRGCAARLMVVLSEQIFPKLPESSFGRESVRELMAFIADVVNLGCRARRAVDS
tara:strand:- start:1579 stop:1878 length:300 start_codon:yes stop_codon:yes gene_type:complete